MDYKVDIPEGTKGSVKIEKFEIQESPLYFSLRNRRIPVGTYTGLYINNCIVMSDTPSEYKDHRYFIYHASGNVLIAGLGIGMVLNEVAKKENVTHITVIEKNQDVIDLVWQHYKDKYGDKIEIFHANIFDWKPLKDAYYDFAWYDIWNDICSDNLKEMTKLHRRFGRKVKNQDSWAKALCKRYK